MLNKFVCCVVVGFLALNPLFSQSYMDEIAKKACQCMSEKNEETRDEQFVIEFGLCIISAAEPYKKRLKKDYKINFDNIFTEDSENTGERLGAIVGMKMVSYCPDLLLKVAQIGESESTPPALEQSVFGKVVNIEDDVFVVVTLKEKSGKISKYYWLTFVELKYDFTENYSSLKDKDVIIEYEQHEFFDPKIKEYRYFSVITSIELLEL